MRVFTEAELKSFDLNARAFGWEVGAGRALPTDERIESSPDNPFVPQIKKPEEG
jgi:hypothetical protein